MTARHSAHAAPERVEPKHSHKPSGSAEPPFGPSTIHTHNRRLSQKLSGSLKSFRLSTLGHAGHASAAKRATTKHLKIGDPVLCSASTHGELDGSAHEQSLFRPSHSARRPPKPPSADADPSTAARQPGSDAPSVSRAAPPDEPAVSVMAPALSLAPLGRADAREERAATDCDAATLEALPQLFDVFRARAYEANTPPPRHVRGALGAGEAAMSSALRGPAGAPAAPAEAPASTDDEGSWTALDTEASRSSGDTEASRSLGDTEASRSLGDTEASRSSSDTRSSTRSTADTDPAQEFYFEDPKPPTRARVHEPSRVISGWRPEQLVSRERASASPAASLAASVAELAQGAPRDKPASRLAPSQVSLGMPQPPMRASRLQGSAAENKSLEDLAALLSSLDLSIGGSDAPAVSSGLRSEPLAAAPASTSRIYREAITRLNEVRRLEVRMLVQRIEQLERDEAPRAPAGDLWPDAFLDKIRGLPRMLPVKPSTST